MLPCPLLLAAYGPATRVTPGLARSSPSGSQGTSEATTERCAVAPIASHRHQPGQGALVDCSRPLAILDLPPALRMAALRVFAIKGSFHLLLLLFFFLSLRAPPPLTSIHSRIHEASSHTRRRCCRSDLHFCRRRSREPHWLRPYRAFRRGRSPGANALRWRLVLQPSGHQVRLSSADITPLLTFSS